MKKIFSILSGLGVMLFMANACKKQVINGDRKELIPGSYITLTNAVNTNLDFTNPDAKVAITIGSVGAAVASVNIYLATGSNALDTGHWKLIKNVPYTKDVELDVKTSEIAAALDPVEINPGNQYVFQNEIILTDGRKFSVTNTPGNFTSQPGYNMAFTWTATAVCAYDQTASVGTYQVVIDDWADFSAGDPITVTAGPGPNQLTMVAYPSPSFGTNRKPIIIDVDPATGAATIKGQEIGDYPGAPGATIRGGGFIFSCTGTISLVNTINAASTDYGNLRFILQLP